MNNNFIFEKNFPEFENFITCIYTQDVWMDFEKNNDLEVWKHSFSENYNIVSIEKLIQDILKLSENKNYVFIF